MSKYKVQFDGTNYLIKEVPTDLIMGQYSNFKTANVVALRLEAGAAFQGNTPTFFTKCTDPIANAQVQPILAAREEPFQKQTYLRLVK